MTVVYCTAAQVGAALGLGWSAQQTVGSNTAINTVYAPTSAGQVYAVGDEIRLNNDDGVSEDETVSAVTYGASYTTLTVGSLTSYAVFTTANNTTVQIKSYFDVTSTPSKDEVEDWIEESQDEIDDFCKRSWQAKRWTNYVAWRPNYPMCLSDIHEFFKIKLPFPNPVTPLSSAAGDSLKVWTGGSEVEFVDVYTESRTGDFWLDKRGWLLINKQRPWPSEHAIYISYRYGDTTAVPKSIRRACIMMTVNKFLDSNMYNNQGLEEAGETSERWPYSNMRQFTWGKIKGTLKNYRRRMLG